MKLKEYIKRITEDVPFGETTLEVSLYGDTSVADVEEFDGEIPIPLKQWTCVTMTRKSNSLCLYINDELDVEFKSEGFTERT